jgi:hypothetical protein
MRDARIGEGRVTHLAMTTGIAARSTLARGESVRTREGGTDGEEIVATNCASSETRVEAQRQTRVPFFSNLLGDDKIADRHADIPTDLPQQAR